MPLFSVIIPVYNRRESVIRTIESVLSQKFTDYELIVVDDGSTDGTFEYLNSLFKNIRLFRKENAGPGAARNYGSARALGEYVAFLDSDDVWYPWTLETFASLIKKYQKPTILSAKVDEILKDDICSSKEQLPIESEYFSSYLDASKTGYLVGAGMAVIRRCYFDEVGRFDVRFINAEDWDLILRLGTASGFVKVLNPVTLGYFRTPESMTGNILNSYIGCKLLISQETKGVYSGGGARRKERLEMLGRVFRAVSIACLKKSMFMESWHIYISTFWWNILLYRWKYIFAFPIITAKQLFLSRN